LKHGDTEGTEKKGEGIVLLEERLTGEIIGGAIEVHREFGPGLLESAYETCLCRELFLRGLRVARQVPMPIEYKGVKLETGYRIDLIVENAVIVELKCIEAILPVHEAQLLTYMRLSGIRVGLIINFYVPVLKDGILRRVL
jgi:GxxExxY protein